MKFKYLEFVGKRLRPVELRLLVKWLLHLKREQVVLPDSRVYEIDPISDLGLRLVKDKFYEPEMTNIIEDLLQKGDSFIDLGANEGYFTILASILVSPSGKVFSIEPQNRLWSIIKNNIMLNDLCNIQLLPYGIGSEKQELMLQLYPLINSGATSFSNSYNFKVAFSKLRKKMYGSQLTKVITLDDLLEVFPTKIKLMKIDIEGYEFEALKGAKKLLENKILTHILIEIHPIALTEMNQSESMIDQLLEAAGYKKRKISADLNLYSAL
jgi:FkbM family methyltransferase